jgi:hypothetical protein
MKVGPHPWKGKGYHCETCFASMHCAACSDASGSQGHSMQDEDGFFFSCQEPDRADAWRQKLFSR